MKREHIVLLHGWGLSARTFEPLASELKRRGYSVVVPDFPGFGTSKMPAKSLLLSDYAEFLAAFLKERRVEEPTLVGHSFGGRVALKYQLLYPKNVRALILSGTPGFTPIDRKKLILFIVMAKIGRAFFSLPLFNLIQSIVRRWYYYLVGARDFYRAEGVMRDTFKYIIQEDLLECMKAVLVPCLLLWGESDTIVPPTVAEKMGRVIPGATLKIIKGADHRVPYQHPEVFTDHLAAFLKTL